MFIFAEPKHKSTMKNQVTLDATDIFVIERAKTTTKERVKMLINDLEIGMSQMLKNKKIDRRHCERRNLLIAAVIDVYNSK